MLTLFTCPKAFTDPHIRTIQRNAIQSWMRLEPRPEILLIGDEEGVADVACEFGLRHVSAIDRNEQGTPLVSSVFEQAQAAASNDLLAYVNADIILSHDFMDAVQVCASLSRFLMVGQRLNTKIEAALDLTGPETLDELMTKVHQEDRYGGLQAIDYFVFRADLWREGIPPFALGRCAWDNWLLYSALARGAHLIDATEAVTAIHQDHDYRHAGVSGSNELWKGQEAKRNYDLAGDKLFDLLDCRDILRKHRLVTPRDNEHVYRRMERLKFLRPRLFRCLFAWKLRYLCCWLFPSL